MRIIWTMACVGYSLHIFKTANEPVFGFDANGWYWFSPHRRDRLSGRCRGLPDQEGAYVVVTTKPPEWAANLTQRLLAEAMFSRYQRVARYAGEN